MGILNKIRSLAEKHDKPDPKVIEEKQVKLGLRNSDGTGVIVGFTSKGEVTGYERVQSADGTYQKVPVPGKLYYCGYDAIELVKAYQRELRFGFEEVTYLLLTGDFPNKKDLEEFNELLIGLRSIPEKEKTIIMDLCAHDEHMSGLHTAVSSLHMFDKNPNTKNLKEMIWQCVNIISKMPIIVAYNYQAKHNKKFLEPKKELSVSENFLYLLTEKIPTKNEALIFDATMILLAEHGGGNNSTFATRVVSSSGANTYMAISSGIASLSGYLHGGAAESVSIMMEDIKANIKTWEDEAEIETYLSNILKDKNNKHQGKIYGMGHAVYTISDPRVEILEKFAENIAKEKNKTKEFLLYKNVAKLSPKVIFDTKKIRTCPNVDFYSGFIYENLGIPQELFTPIFAMSRVAGWGAHRIEEAVQGKLIRPAYVNAHKEKKKYVPIEKR